jgi:uncharacterized protein YdiU (UPF0061 family)
VIVWNMAQFATALVPLMPDADAAVEEFTSLVHAMPDRIEAEWRRAFAAKIGIAEPGPEDAALVGDLLARMAEGRADFTNTFRALATGGARDQFLEPAAFDSWEEAWRARLAREADPTAVMRGANPSVIPRNHRIEQMIEAGLSGDFKPFERLLDVLSQPFETRADAADLRRPPAASEVVQATFCGT